MKDILRIASKLDESGQFYLSDKLMKIAQGILAAPQPSFGRPTPILAPPRTSLPSNQDRLDPGVCSLVSGVYSKDIGTLKNMVIDEIRDNKTPLTIGAKSDLFLQCLQKYPKYTKEQKYAFQAQSFRIREEQSDTSKGKFYQIIYALLKKYKVTENDLHLYKNKEEFTNQFGRMTDDLLKKLSIPGVMDSEFQKTNEYKFLFNTYVLLKSRF